MLEKTWRWFGENDKITLGQIRQIGIEGIVTALHHIPNGEVWSVEEIKKTQAEIEKYGMRWSVVESLPVHEIIKYGGVERDQLIENYKKSLVNLGECGLKTICYNFMPVIDWIRTDLNYRLPDTTEVLYFNFVDFVVFDRFILEREQAAEEYPKEIVEKAALRFGEMSEQDKNSLVDTIVVKTQGFIDGISADEPAEAARIFKQLLQNYKEIDDAKLRANLKYFLDAILPTAEEQGIKMSIHPDDPPMKVLGLPRIVGTMEDLDWIFEHIPSPSNALTFCTGSLGARADNDLKGMMQKFKARIHFAHLRSTQLVGNGDFYEAEHLGGGVDMYEMIRSLLLEQKNRASGERIPMRVDHGRRLLADFNNAYNPGYPLFGRMKAMAEISGLEMGVLKNINS
ncbi:mannonate dehydratase [Flammeovirgaceae bacterium SG7u.111]|nr:mannonate dehydratase [Flammeovirgaceae bacterium SG7u.132]WPO33531.1 mannonate dehydratase [Flammeovirgaceae bacterium SG7u.111]